MYPIVLSISSDMLVYLIVGAILLAAIAIFLLTRLRRDVNTKKLDEFLFKLNKEMEKYYRSLGTSEPTQWDPQMVQILLKELSSTTFRGSLEENLDRLKSLLEKQGYTFDYENIDYEVMGKTIQVPSFQVKTKSLNQLYVRSFKDYQAKLKSKGPSVVDLTPLSYESLVQDIRYFGEDFRPADPTYRNPVLLDLNQLLNKLPVETVKSLVIDFIKQHQKAHQEFLDELTQNKDLYFINLKKILGGKKLYESPLHQIEQKTPILKIIKQSNIKIVRECVQTLLNQIFQSIEKIEDSFKLPGNFVLNRPLEESLTIFFQNQAQQTKDYFYVYQGGFYTTVLGELYYALFGKVSASAYKTSIEVNDEPKEMEYYSIEEMKVSGRVDPLAFYDPGEQCLINMDRINSLIPLMDKPNTLLNREYEDCQKKVEQLKKEYAYTSIQYLIYLLYLKERYGQYLESQASRKEEIISLLVRAAYAYMIAKGSTPFLACYFLAEDFNDPVLSNGLSLLILRITRTFSLKDKTKIHEVFNQLSQVEKSLLKQEADNILEEALEELDEIFYAKSAENTDADDDEDEVDDEEDIEESAEQENK